MQSEASLVCLFSLVTRACNEVGNGGKVGENRLSSPRQTF